MNTQKLMAEATAEMNRLHDLGWTRQLDFDSATLMSVIGALQLALRHPGFSKRPSAKLVHGIVCKMIEGFPPDCPSTIELAKLGFDKAFDTP